MRTGIIIGGPMDGQHLSHEAEVFDYYKTPESLAGPIDYSDMTATQAAMRAESTRGRYYFTDMAVLGSTGHATGRRIGFWVEYDKTLDDALTALLTRYHEPQKNHTLLRRAGRVLDRLFRKAYGYDRDLFNEVVETLQDIERTLHEDQG